MKKLFTKVLCSLLLVAAFNQVNAQNVETYSSYSNETIKTTNTSVVRGDNWLYYDNGNFQDAIGGSTLTFMAWGIMIPSDKLSVDQLITKVSFYNYAMHDGEINIYYGGTDAPDPNMLIHKQPYSTTSTNEFLEFELTSPLPVFEGENLWVILSTNNADQFPAAVSSNTDDKNGRWISLDGIEWYDLKADFQLDGTFMVRVCAEGGEGISELNSSVSVYPNPVKDQLFVETEMTVEEISVYDVFGRQMTTVYDQQTVNVSELSNGVYFVKVKSENNEVVKRFIKK